jgi:hypothetical protein
MTSREERWPRYWAARTFSAMLLIVTAFACLAITLFLPFDLAAQARVDRFYYKQFQQAAAHVQRTGRLPSRRMLDHFDGRAIDPVSMSASDCGPTFKKLASDRLVLSFWRGEWTECYAFPSGRTTLRMSVMNYIIDGFWQFFVASLVIITGAIWGAVRLMKRLRPAIIAINGGG